MPPALDYKDGGTITQVISHDARLQQIMSSGQTVQATVYNSLTNLRSASFTFTR